MQKVSEHSGNAGPAFGHDPLVMANAASSDWFLFAKQTWAKC